MKEVSIFTDGSCRGNPGPGGWAAVLCYGPHQKILKGRAVGTTNNRMELQAVIEGLTALKEPCNVTVITDSKYVKDGMKWMRKWKLNGWKTTAKRDVKNKELWRVLDSLQKEHDLHFKWTKAHADSEYNNLADRIAQEESGRAANNGI